MSKHKFKTNPKVKRKTYLKPELDLKPLQTQAKKPKHKTSANPRMLTFRLCYIRVYIDLYLCVSDYLYTICIFWKLKVLEHFKNLTTGK